MNLWNKKILVTGGSGFIGSSLINKLLELGANVTNFDLSEGYHIEDQNNLKKYIKKKFDIVYHLAGFSGAKESNEQRLRSFRINTFATVNLCELILKYSPYAKLILSSSRQEYGKLNYLPVDENHPTNPISVYGLSKLMATQMALIYHQKNKFNVTIFRTSNVYGPHPNTKFAGYNIINHFIDLAKRDEPLTVFGDGKQLRDYIYIDDLVEAFVKAAKSHEDGGQIYNLGYGKGIQFIKMAKLIVYKIGKGKIKFRQWPKDFLSVETGDYISDLSKIKNELSFVPKVSFEKGVEKTIKFSL